VGSSGGKMQAKKVSAGDKRKKSTVLQRCFSIPNDFYPSTYPKNKIHW